jgi:hypothetical protein
MSTFSLPKYYEGEKGKDFIHHGVRKMPILRPDSLGLIDCVNLPAAQRCSVDGTFFF